MDVETNLSGPAATGYRVLARKYRPTTFDDLIGQDAVVRTLRNAFATGRIAQAYMLTGVRGVGKTTTARLIARALNYVGPGGDKGPTMDMAEPGLHCEAILQSRHVDVMEMDAASRTGVDDIREIIEQVRYGPLTARYKVYIIDEVHMLSKHAFNALLKTLEEPPAHVKFIFATTEVRKVPVTVLSRCQRFDLRRVGAGLLIDHFRRILAAEDVTADDEALRLIARAAEGSVRDGLSLLDQAIAYCGRHLEGTVVQQMLGVADRARIADLFQKLMTGDAAGALSEFEAQHDQGNDPLAILSDLAQLVHWVTRVKVVPASADDPTRSESEREAGRRLAQGLAMPALTRAWQMLLKGLEEVSASENPALAAEMVLIRLAYAADLPDPADLVRRLTEDGEGKGTIERTRPADTSAARPLPLPPAGARMAASEGGTLAERAEPARRMAPAEPGESSRPLDFSSLADIALYVGERRDIKLKSDIERFVRPIRVETGRIEMALEPGASPGLPGEIARRLEGWTGVRWMVTVAREGGEPPLSHQRKSTREGLLASARELPAVRAVLERFPGAEIVDVKPLGGEEPASAEADEEPLE
jgi:DNA polymerase-3 subunit gamma/tau